MTDTLPETLEEIKSLCSFLINAEQTLLKGNDIDMTGIDDRIEIVCETVQNAKRIQQDVYARELDKLLKLLNKCEKTMDRMQDKKGAAS